MGTYKFGEVIGLHIVKCSDGQLPNDDYSYDTFVCPLSLITIVK